MIAQLVRSFYARARDDAVLEPLFATNIKDWEPHLQKMIAFRSSVTLMALFAKTAQDVCLPAAAERFCRIGRSLEHGLARSRGVIPRKGKRYLARRMHADSV